jgi:hypothetical protein
MDVILHRISTEIGSTADDLQEIEGQVASIIGGTNVDSLERLQSLDRLGQQLRALQDFLAAAKPCECGRVDIEAALERIPLEGVRKRLGGGRAQPAAAVEPELW